MSHWYRLPLPSAPSVPANFCTDYELRSGYQRGYEEADTSVQFGNRGSTT